MGLVELCESFLHPCINCTFKSYSYLIHVPEIGYLHRSMVYRLDHFTSIGSPLKCVTTYPSPQSQEARYLKLVSGQNCGSFHVSFNTVIFNDSFI